MPVDYSPFAIVLVALVMGVLFVFGTMTLVRNWLAWKLDRPEKGLTYECGEDTIGSAWLRFNIRFYLVGIVFLLFEVELVLTLPLILLYRASWEASVTLKDGLGQAYGHTAGWFVVGELFMFLAVLLVGLANFWMKGDLNWVRAFRKSDKPIKRDLMPERRVTAQH